jgi:hypothetical protein
MSKAPATEAEEAVIMHLPNMLALKIGPRFNTLSPTTLAKAEAALQKLVVLSDEWMRAEINGLCTAHQAFKASGLNPTALAQLALSAAGLKSQAAAHEFAIVGQVAGSLCDLLTHPKLKSVEGMLLVDAHIDAAKACVRHGIRALDHPLGKTLIETLITQVALLTSAT